MQHTTRQLATRFADTLPAVTGSRQPGTIGPLGLKAGGRQPGTMSPSYLILLTITLLRLNDNRVPLRLAEEKGGVMECQQAARSSATLG